MIAEVDMARIADTLSWTSEEAALKAHLGVVGAGEDALLEPMLLAAFNAADQYIDSDWLDADTEEDLPIPAPVVLGIYEWVRAVRAVRLRPAVGVNRVKTDVLEEQYDATSSTLAAGQTAAATYWWPHKELVIH